MDCIAPAHTHVCCLLTHGDLVCWTFFGEAGLLLAIDQASPIGAEAGRPPSHEIEPGATQVGPSQLRVLQVCAAQVRPSQAGPAQVRMAEIGANQGRSFEVRSL